MKPNATWAGIDTRLQAVNAQYGRQNDELRPGRKSLHTLVRGLLKCASRLYEDGEFARRELAVRLSGVGNGAFSVDRYKIHFHPDTAF